MQEPVSLDVLLAAPASVLVRLTPIECMRYQAFPFSYDEAQDTLTVAMPFPDDLDAVDMLRQITDAAIVSVKITEAMLFDAYRKKYQPAVIRKEWDALCAEMTRFRFLRAWKEILHKAWMDSRPPRMMATADRPLVDRVMAFLFMSAMTIDVTEVRLCESGGAGHIQALRDDAVLLEAKTPPAFLRRLVASMRLHDIPPSRECYWSSVAYHQARMEAVETGANIFFSPVYRAAYIGVGSNIDPEIHPPAAFQSLAQTPGIHLHHRACLSPVYKTPAIDRPEQPDYCNTVWKVYSQIPSDRLQCVVLREIENACGRVRTDDRYAARTLDLDLLLYTNEEIQSETMTLPNPDILTRPFLAAGLLAIEPNLRLPGMREGLSELPVANEALELMRAEEIESSLTTLMQSLTKTIDQKEKEETTS